MGKTQLIVGVEHEYDTTKNIVIDYIDEKYPSLESIMLELHPNYKSFSSDGWFYDIANYYESKGVKVISGDRKKLEIYNMTSENFALTTNEENFFKSLKFNIREKIYVLTGLLNGKVIKNRNIDMDLVFKDYKPDVVVVGNLHALYLKEKNPDAYFASFTNINHLKINFPKISDYKTKKIAQTRTIIHYNRFNPNRISKYAKNTLFASLAYAMLAYSTKKLIDSEFPSSIFYGGLQYLSTYGCFEYSKSAINFLHSLKHKLLDKNSVNF